jgi:hypothetical protein
VTIPERPILTNRWKWIGVIHWHEFMRHRVSDSSLILVPDREPVPDAILESPETVADWLDTHVREHIVRRMVRVHDRWGEVGDTEDMARLWSSNAATASHGGSIWMPVRTETGKFVDLLAEAIFDADHCKHGDA